MRSSQLSLWTLTPPADGLPTTLDLSLLTVDEQRRASSHRVAADGLLFAATRIALRVVLGRQLDMEPVLVPLVRRSCPRCGGPHGKPTLPPGYGNLHFSVSHCAGRALLGLSSAPIGVDIQSLPSPRTAELCATALHPREQLELALLRQHRRASAFGRLWVRKEAYLKALGTGLAHGMKDEYLGDTSTSHPAGWTVADLTLNSSHLAAFALHHSNAPSPEVQPIPPRWLSSGSHFDAYQLNR